VGSKYRYRFVFFAVTVRQFKWALVSRQTFLWHQDARPDTLTDIQRAARFYYLQKLAFGAKPTGQTFGISAMSPPRINLLGLEEDLSAAYLRLSRVLIERLDWAECIRRYDRPGTLFYCDPPYWQTTGYGGEFGMDQYQRMADLAKSIQGKMLISINDHPDIQEVFAGLPMERVGIKYTVGGSGRSQETGELLIRSWF
jgi:DNA adenine methylase